MPDNTSNRVHLRWAMSPRIGASKILIIYRQMIEASAREKFLWMLYSAPNIVTLILQRVHAEAHVWCINMSVLNFSTVEWYNTDRWYMTRWHIYLYGGQLMIILDHDYRCGSQPMMELNPDNEYIVEPDLEDQHMVEPDLDTWVDAFCEGFQSSSYHPKMGGFSSTYTQPQPPITFAIFYDTTYSTSPQAMFDPTVDPPDVYSIVQRPPHQWRPIKSYTSNDNTTPSSFQF
ncbi:hypothetical protein GOBAR_DD28089 [Gossypium barbadense]|nr:hypothetical protein GOBAR_DD28089 [Gossypium barbadense]